MRTKECSSTLVVSYLHHGIVYCCSLEVTFSRHSTVGQILEYPHTYPDSMPTSPFLHVRRFYKALSHHLHPLHRASTSISPDHRLLAVSNLTHGFDIYNLKTYAIEGRMLNGVGIGRVVPVLFIHHGCAVIGGNTTGTVRMWDVDSAHFMHALEHGGMFTVDIFTLHSLSSFRSKENFIC